MGNGFKNCIPIILELEGGLVNNKLDKGGATNFGISMASLSAWRGKECTFNDVKCLTREEAERIYFEKYWVKSNLDLLIFPKIQLILFDQIVNCGAFGAIRRAQIVVKAMTEASLKCDGVMGAKTAALLNDPKNQDDFLNQYFYATQRNYADFASRIPSQTVFLKGWINRTHKVWETLKDFSPSCITLLN